MEAITLAFYVKGLTPAQKAVLVALADHADVDGCKVYPSVKRLCIKTSYADRTVRRALSDLREMGLIIVVKESSYHHQTVYRLDLSQMQVLSERPATSADHDLPESAEDLPENTERPATNAGKPSYNPQKPSVKPSIIYMRDEDPLFYDMVSALSVEAKDRLWAKTEDDFYDAAESLRRDNVNPESIQGFRLWWNDNGHYTGPPALKSIMQTVDVYLAGGTLEPSKNGQHPAGKTTSPDIAPDENRVGGVF